jgi:putative transposase
MLRARIREICPDPKSATAWAVFSTSSSQEGWPDNHKRAHRLFKLERPESKNEAVSRATGPPLTAKTSSQPLVYTRAGPFILWPLCASAAVNSVAYHMNNDSRQCLALEVDQSMKAEQVVAVMDRLKQEHGRALGAYQSGQRQRIYLQSL